MATNKVNIKDLTAQARATISKVALETKLAPKSLDFGSMDAVDQAIKAGLFVVRFRSSFSKDVVFGVGQPLNFFGGSMNVLNSGEGAFATTRLGGNFKKEMSEGTTVGFWAEGVSDCELEVLEALKEANPAQYKKIVASMDRDIREVDMNKEYWEAVFSLLEIGGEGKINFNCPEWNAAWVEEATAKSADGEMKSFEWYFVLQDVRVSDFKPVLKPKNLALDHVMGREIDVKLICAKFLATTASGGNRKLLDNKETNESMLTLGNYVYSREKANTLVAAKEDLAEVSFGNRALPNAVDTFEAGIADGKWLVDVERQLLVMAASSKFSIKNTPNFWCTMAAKDYFKALKKTFKGEMDYTSVNPKGAVKEANKATEGDKPKGGGRNRGV